LSKKINSSRKAGNMARSWVTGNSGMIQIIYGFRNAHDGFRILLCGPVAIFGF
jgi:hypothetical protein